MNGRGVAVLLVASHDAALAFDAFGYVEVETVLLSRPWRRDVVLPGAFDERQFDLKWQTIPP
jgi:hypothetical protein